MRLRHEASLGIGSILLLQVLLSTLGIVLLSRMSPAIAHILQDNVFSGEAVEEMLAIMAEPESLRGEQRQEHFDQAWQRARENVTEDAEEPLLERIRERRLAALAGDEQAATAVVGALRELAHVNRESMRQSDRQARRLGQAGAWAAAMLGALALVLGVMIYRRLRLRFELPVELVRQTLERVSGGERRARCVVPQGPLEVRQIARDLNRLLDRWATESAATSPKRSAVDTDLRLLLLWWMDQDRAPALVWATDGHVVAMNKAMQALESTPIDPSGGVAEGWVSEAIGSSNLCVVRPAAPPKP